MLGHEAIRLYYNLKPKKGEECFSLKTFWADDNVPAEIAEKIGNFDQFFGQMFKKSFWFYNLYEILYNPAAPDKWQEKSWQELYRREKKDSLFTTILAVKFSDGEIADEWRVRAWEEMMKRGVREPEITLPYLSRNASGKFSLLATAEFKNYSK